MEVVPASAPRPGLTPGCLGPAMLLLTGMELGLGRGEEEVGVAAVGVFVMEKGEMNINDGMVK